MHAVGNAPKVLVFVNNLTPL